MFFKTSKAPKVNSDDNAKISINNLSKSFGSKQILKDISLDIANGESLVIIGGSGTGKSVFIKNIIGLLTPSSGSIKIDGQEVANMSSSERYKMMHKFGMLFQGGALFDSLPVWQNICFSPLQRKKITKKEAYQLAIEKLAAVGLNEDVAILNPSELSGGMQKRVSLARAICENPEIILFDEPTTGLDPIMADVINDLIVKCSKEIGATTITITHDMQSVRKIADKVAMIYEGEVIWHDKIQNLDTTKNSYVKQFINGEAKGPIQMKTRKL